MKQNVQQLPGGTRQSGAMENVPDPKDLTESVHRPAIKELQTEGASRGLNTLTHTVRAGDICPSQGARAASGFVSCFA